MSTDSEHRRTVANNRRARHDYLILDELECGIVLTGTEVKTLRGGQCSIGEAHARVIDEELFLIGMHIPEYNQGNIHNHVPVHDRKLLCHRRELTRWHKRVREKGVTMVPLAVYFKGSRVKVLIGLARGKRLYDKREAQRSKDDRREMDRALKRRG
jgi:SsrA-binding protein